MKGYFVLTLLGGLAFGQQPITHQPAVLASGSPVLFRAVLPRATALRGTWLTHTVTFTRGVDGAWTLLAGIDVEQTPGNYAIDLTETFADGTTAPLTETVEIGEADYRTSTINVPDKFLQPDAATLARVERESALKKAAFAHETPMPLWSGDFERPVSSMATDSFGTRRTFNGRLASIHKGADFRAPSGTPVYAANAGVVLIAQPMFYEGNFVLLDHGQQFMSMYMHFSRIDVRVGEPVRKGQQLGLSGATGRVTGPHLHFATRWQGAYVDPIKLLGMHLP